jgi:8-oxo-dGTP diphosphatase
VGRLYLVRHADAGHRAGAADDTRRPLSTKGERQAAGLANALGDAGITHLYASPFLRCMQTLVPLGQRLGVQVQECDELAEGAGAAGALALATAHRDTSIACSSHGDVIPDVLEALLAQGMRLKDELRWQKASTWVLTWDGDRIAKGRYLPPPG